MKRDSQAIPIAGIIIIILLIFVISCAPLPVSEPSLLDVTPLPTITPATEFLNYNPDLDFGGCETVMFETEQWGREYIQQCVPDGYTFYEHSLNNPMPTVFTGTDYSIRPLDNNGSIGYMLPPMRLTPGTYIVKVYGFSDVWGPDTYSVQARYEIEGTTGSAYMGAHDLSANGPYRAMFTLEAPALGVYNVFVYLRITHANMTAGSYFTFGRITVEASPGGETYTATHPQ